MPPYLTVEEAAERLGVDYKTIYRLIRSGEIPAGKIGRVYRILESDLDAYFQKQKDVTARQAGRMPKALAESRCASCGSGIISVLSVGGTCPECGREICMACWSIRKVRSCPEHLRAATTPPTERVDDAGVPDAGAPAADAKPPAPGAEAPAESPAQAVARLQAEGRPAISAAGAVQAEDDFIRAFARRLDLVDELPDPLSGQTINLRRTRVRYELTTAEAMKKPAASMRRAAMPHLPANRISRFILRSGGWSRPKACVVLEAQFVCRLHVLAARGYDADPITDAELTPILNAIADRAAKAECFCVALLGSPTGWTPQAAAMIAGRGGVSPFSERLVGVALHDLHANTIAMDESDERLRAFARVIGRED